MLATEGELQWLIQKAREEYNRRKQTIADCEKQLDRLEPVYRKLSEIKSDFRKARASTREVFTEKGSWRGEKHTEFSNAGSRLDDSCGDYYNQLDKAHDLLNTKIGELKATKSEQLPLIGTLLGNIQRWTVELQNLGN